MLQFLISRDDKRKIGKGLDSLAELYASILPGELAQIELSLIGTAAMQSANSDYRKINQPTDVLSFPVYTNLQELPLDHPYLLGSILICPEKAATYHEPLLDLVHHGFLHLIGFDHETKREEWDMMEKRLLDRLVGSDVTISPAPE